MRLGVFVLQAVPYYRILQALGYGGNVLCIISIHRLKDIVHSVLATGPVAAIGR